MEEARDYSYYEEEVRGKWQQNKKQRTTEKFDDFDDKERKSRKRKESKPTFN